MSMVEIKLDDDLLALIDERAAASGKARDEVIDTQRVGLAGHHPVRRDRGGH